MSTILSLYIPVIQDSISEDFIKKCFEDKKIGKIMRVDFVKNLARNRREAFIHFDEWFDTDESKTLKESVTINTIQTRLIYNTKGNYWPLLVNKNAHKRNHNPNYEIISHDEVKNVYKNNLSILITKKLDEKMESKKSKA